jgi:signal transduction histidine kinase
MQLGMVGLGRMGGNIVRRLMRAEHAAVVYDHNPEAVRGLAGEGATGAVSLEDLAACLEAPPVVWVMLPAGDITEATIQQLASLLEEAYDYQDTGKAVTVIGAVQGTIVTNPHALRRILTNFIDNALEFADSAEIGVERRDGCAAIMVLDRGPGTPEDRLEAAMRPFFRLEPSRNRETGGTGLGLAIAQQVATTIGGSDL